jgi:hypothetical protein
MTHTVDWSVVGDIGSGLSGAASVLALVGVVVATIYARRQLAEARTTRLEQTQPYVMATPIPELSQGRQAALQIKNHGQSAAHDVQVHFPKAVLLPHEDGWKSGNDL